MRPKMNARRKDYTLWIGLGGAVGVFLVLGLTCGGCIVAAILINDRPAEVGERNENPIVARIDEPREEAPPEQPLAAQHQYELPDPPGQRPFAVDPVLANVKDTVYLSDLQEFAWKPGPRGLALRKERRAWQQLGAEWPYPRQRGCAAQGFEHASADTRIYPRLLCAGAHREIVPRGGRHERG